MQEIWVQSLSQEDSLEKGRPATPVFLPGEFYGWRSPDAHHLIRELGMQHGAAQMHGSGVNSNRKQVTNRQVLLCVRKSVKESPPPLPTIEVNRVQNHHLAFIGNCVHLSSEKGELCL